MAFTSEQNTSINDFWLKNRGNPDQLRAAMDQYGVDVNGLAGATGVGVQDLNNYFTNAGVKDGWQGVTTNKAAYAPSFAGQDPNESYLNVMGRPTAMQGNPLGNSGTNAPALAAAGPTVVGGTAPGQTAAQGINKPPAPSGANLGMGGAAGGPGGGMAGYEYQRSPYLDSMATNITRQVNDNWTRNLAPSIRSGAMQAGGFGGSRQGVVEANALKDINSGLSGALSNLYNSDYQQSMGRNLQRYQGDQSFDLGVRNNNLGIKNSDQSYDLGLRNNDLGFSNLDFNINQGNVHNQLQGANLGMNTWNAQQGANQGAITAGTNMQNTPYNNWSNFNTAANSVGNGLAGETTNKDAQGNPLMGALGGWQLGTKFAGNLGFGPPVTDDGYSVGDGSAYGGNRKGL